MTDHLYSMSALRANGYSYYDVRRLLGASELSPVRRGTYFGGVLPDSPDARHRLVVRSAMRELGPGAVVSHVSAAVLHGLATWTVPLDRVHVTKDRREHGRRSRSLHLHTARLDGPDVMLVNGVPTTSVARTVIDLARTVSFEQAVVIADSALATGRVGHEELTDLLGHLVRRQGLPQARRVAGFADGGAESVGESLSRIKIALAGLPRPELQREIRDRHGRLVGRTDFMWPEDGIIGEFDGRTKYGRLLRPGQSAGDAVFEEKRREDAIRAESWEVVRWTWTDLDNFAEIAAGWHRARARARRRP
ncbi:type IV toxin-antitoxin system AbiEi family antitoxin domain-containing protein [Pseudonocardia spinosispora]|uniref:type IV toxin-antitoxin system AbiEi family antitoxin domain-containing protein n=1 Tax=Pseudonocardia spinosispora TaxID=103441 RepID=UPI0012EBBE11|nr:hypothetical protein [Pseudonocardia spinosispora]